VGALLRGWGCTACPTSPPDLLTIPYLYQTKLPVLSTSIKLSSCVREPRAVGPRGTPGCPWCNSRPHGGLTVVVHLSGHLVRAHDLTDPLTSSSMVINGPRVIVFQARAAGHSDLILRSNR
jgi:hypothetical protein